MILVVDASVAVKWFVDEPGHRAALALTTGDKQLIAPDFALLETLNVLRRKFRLGNLQEDQLRASSHVLPGYFDRLVSTSLLVSDTMGLAAEMNHSVYDCAYLACARMVDAVFLTADIRFAEKAESAGYGAIVRRLDQA